MPLLSKSKYLYGLQCPKFLWMAVHEKDKLPEIDEALQFRFDQGHLVGELAKKLFPKGVDVPEGDFMGNIRESKELISKRKTVFEAGIMTGSIYSRADVLKPAGKGEWDIIEVKSGTSVKDVNLHDLAFQKFCYEKAGLKINDCFLMHLNNKYVKKGEIDPNGLFSKTEVNDLVEGASKDVESNINEMLKLISSKTAPEMKVCEDCKGPKTCALPECWDFLPESNVFSLYRGGKKSRELYDSGVSAIKDIPVDFNLSDNQHIQKKCAETGKPYIDEKKIKSYVDSLEFPLYFLDFETYTTAIPLYDGLSPYQQIPFQFSLHVLDSWDSELKHISFLAEGDADPRIDFLSALKNNIGNKGSIIVYNQAFESRIMDELKRDFPTNSKWIDSMNSRFSDLLIPFRKFHYYDPKQEGSASIKKVLPALTGKSYSDLGIAGGENASLQYLFITHGNNGNKLEETEIIKIRKDLEKYCALDTMGMVDILEVLREKGAKSQ